MTKTRVRSARGVVSRRRKVHGSLAAIELEPQFWDAFDEICRREQTDDEALLSGIAERNRSLKSDLAEAVRLFVVGYFKQAVDFNLDSRQRDPLTYALDVISRS